MNNKVIFYKLNDYNGSFTSPENFEKIKSDYPNAEEVSGTIYTLQEVLNHKVTRCTLLGPAGSASGDFDSIKGFSEFINIREFANDKSYDCFMPLPKKDCIFNIGGLPDKSIVPVYL